MTFCKKVKIVTRQIPKGMVASYGQIASLISTTRAARAVGWCLHGMGNDKTIPWHRVINSKGYITTTCASHPALLQKALLEKEGVKAMKKEKLWWIDLKQYLWKP